MGRRTRGAESGKGGWPVWTWGVEEGPRPGPAGPGARVCGTGFLGMTDMHTDRQTPSQVRLEARVGSAHLGRASPGFHPPARCHLAPGKDAESLASPPPAPGELPRRPALAQVGEGIKKQYLCQQKTFAERLNPHSAKVCASLVWYLTPCPASPWSNGQAWTSVTKGSLATHPRGGK